MWLPNSQWLCKDSKFLLSFLVVFSPKESEVPLAVYRGQSHSLASLLLPHSHNLLITPQNWGKSRRLDSHDKPWAPEMSISSSFNDRHGLSPSLPAFLFQPYLCITDSLSHSSQDLPIWNTLPFCTESTVPFSQNLTFKKWNVTTL